jgi:hypothetical protein
VSICVNHDPVPSCPIAKSTTRRILWPTEVGVVPIGQLLSMHTEDGPTALVGHVDTVEEPGLHVVAEISS